MFGKLKCSNCGAANDKKSKFCSECGNPLAGIVCSSCGMQIGAEYKFCPNCGATITQVRGQRSRATPISEEMGKIRVWQRNPNDFAHRFEVSDIKGLFSKKLTVMSGTKALFLQGGRFFGELPPGTYTVGGLIHVIKTLNIAEKATVILVDDSDVGLDFNISGLRTKENFEAAVKGKIVVNVEEPILFFNNLMKGREHIAMTDIEVMMLRNEMRNLLQSKVKQHSFEDLYGNLELKNELEQDFVHLLNTTLSRGGLKLVYMPYFDYDERYWQDLIAARGESARDLIRRREQIKRDAEMQLAEYEQKVAAKEQRLTSEKKEHEIEEEREDLEDKRLGLTKRMRARLTEDKMDEFQNAEELEQFLYALDKDKVIRENEMVEFKQIFAENREERAFARKLMLKRVEQRHEQDMDAERHEHKLDMERKEHELKLEKERKEDEHDRIEAEQGINLLKQMKAAKREDAAGYQTLELDKMQKEVELEEQRLKARSAATDEAIISMTKGKQAEHISNLARMKRATGLTDEQILALGAKDSAAIAEAFNERYKLKSADEIMNIYEDLLGDMDKLARAIQEIADKGGDQIERMAAKALEQMGTTAATRAAQGATSEGTTVVTGGGYGQPVVVGESATPTPPFQEVKIMCPECNTELPVGTKFCTNCGASIKTKDISQKESEMLHPVTDNVHFTLTAPSIMLLSNSYILDVWMHLAEQRQAVIARAIEAQGQEDIRIKSKGPVKIARDIILTVHLSIPDLTVKDHEDTILWDGNIGNASFPITVPADVYIGRHSGEVFFYVKGLQIAKLYFDLEVGHRESAVEQLVTREQRIRSAFASYASADRDEVLARIQGIVKVLPDLDFFLDVASLRSGEDWEERLRDEISKRDIFYLFWSFAASRSKWVEMEWRTALYMRGIEYIDPVPIDPPDVVSPPKELAKLHFNDWTIAYMRGKKI